MNNIILLFIIVSALGLILLALNFLLSPHRPDEAKLSIYECGFQTIPLQTRSTFQIHFYIVGLLFLIFDLEILLLLPVSLTLYKISTYGFSFAIIFFIILTVGFALEIGYGAISLEKLNLNNSNKNKNNFNPNILNSFTSSLFKLRNETI
jgi:NADH-ubiquinone oxidoreductase chain 3